MRIEICLCDYVVEKYAGELFYNIVTKADFDPHDYKYGSFIYYLEALPYFPIMSMKYISESILNPNTTGSFRDFVISMKILDQRNMTIFWMQRAQIALIGGLSVLVIYQIVKKLFHKHAALLAAFTLAVLPLHVRESHYIVPDLAITFFISLSILFMVNLFQTGKLKWYILSGFMIGFSSTLKYFPLALLAYPFALLLVKKKDWYWIRNSMIGIVSILPGAFAGVPYLFLNPQTNIPVFRKVWRRRLTGTGLPSLNTHLLSCYLSVLKARNHCRIYQSLFRHGLPGITSPFCFTEDSAFSPPLPR